MKARWWEMHCRGTQAEKRVPSAWTENGPFSAREAAETFATAIAGSGQIAEVRMEESED